MFATLLVGTALAAPPRLGLAIGPVMGGGTSTHGSYFSAAPAANVTVTWHLGPFESWVGASGSLLLAGYGDEVIPASLLQGEIGVGFGGEAVGAGFYGGSGFPGPILGVYGRATLPGDGWVRRIGVESRLFHTRVTDSVGLAVLLRVEPGFDDRGERRRRGPRPHVARSDAPEATAANGAPGGEAPAATESTEGPALAIPVGSAAGPEPAGRQPPATEPAPASGETGSAPDDAGGSGTTHHDDPY